MSTVMELSLDSSDESDSEKTEICYDSDGGVDDSNYLGRVKQGVALYGPIEEDYIQREAEEARATPLIWEGSRRMRCLTNVWQFSQNICITLSRITIPLRGRRLHSLRGCSNFGRRMIFSGTQAWLLIAPVL